MVTKITCRYSFEVLDFNCNDFVFTSNIGVPHLYYYDINGSGQFIKITLHCIASNQFRLAMQNIEGVKYIIIHWVGDYV